MKQIEKNLNYLFFLKKELINNQIFKLKISYTFVLCRYFMYITIYCFCIRISFSKYWKGPRPPNTNLCQTLPKKFIYLFFNTKIPYPPYTYVRYYFKVKIN